VSGEVTSGLWRSRPGGERAPGWRGWVLGLGAAWMAPPLIGIALLWLLELTGIAPGQNAVLRGLVVAAGLMVWSMMFAAAWMAPLALVAWALLRAGLGGWLPFLLAGAVAGGLGILLLPGMEAAAGAGLGALNALILRAVFSLIVPAIFTGR